jgi:hypothetical protein
LGTLRPSASCGRLALRSASEGAVVVVHCSKLQGDSHDIGSAVQRLRACRVGRRIDCCRVRQASIPCDNPVSRGTARRCAPEQWTQGVRRRNAPATLQLRRLDAGHSQWDSTFGDPGAPGTRAVPKRSLRARRCRSFAFRGRHLRHSCHCLRTLPSPQSRSGAPRGVPCAQAWRKSCVLCLGHARAGDRPLARSTRPFAHTGQWM